MNSTTDGANMTISSNMSALNVTKMPCLNDLCLSAEDYLDFVEDYVFPKPVEWCLVALYAITFILGITGNSMVCYAIWINNSMRTVTNIFIVNLAVADLVVILVCLTPTLIADITNTWFFGYVMCKIALFLQVSNYLIRIHETFNTILFKKSPASYSNAMKYKQRN